MHTYTHTYIHADIIHANIGAILMQTMGIVASAAVVDEKLNGVRFAAKLSAKACCD